VRLSKQRFSKLTGEGKAPAAPVIQPDLSGMEKRLESMEKLLRGIVMSMPIATPAPAPVAPAPVKIESPAMLERLWSIEEKLRDLAVKRTDESWNFDVRRNANGKIMSVQATKNRESEGADLA
jgi:hypothetical protein